MIVSAQSISSSDIYLRLDNLFARRDLPHQNVKGVTPHPASKLRGIVAANKGRHPPGRKYMKWS